MGHQQRCLQAHRGKVQQLPAQRWGGIVDDLLVYRMQHEDDHHYVLVVNASNIAKDWDWIQGRTASMPSSRTSATTCRCWPSGAEGIGHPAAVVPGGPLGHDLLHGAICRDEGVGLVLISTTGYTGAGGFEVTCRTPRGEGLERGDGTRCRARHQPCGLAARDTLRLEMGFACTGTTSTTPPHRWRGLGLDHQVHGTSYIPDALKAQKEQGVARKLVGFEMVDRGIPGTTTPSSTLAAIMIGQVTSGTQSPRPRPSAWAMCPPAAPPRERSSLIDVRGRHPGREASFLKS